MIRGDLDQGQILIRGDGDLRNELSRKYTHVMNLLGVTIAACELSVLSL